MRRAVVTIGTFDGVHRGHQAILRFLVERAEARGGVPVLLTFDPHPREIITGTPVPLLTTPQERAALVAGFGVKETVILPFDADMAAMSAEQFVEQILVDRLHADCVVIGYDHGFGKGRRGNEALLRTLGPEMGFDVEVIPAQEVDATVVSSTTVRKALMDDGDVAAAASMLGRPYRWRGLVVEGDRRGRTIGFPTANLDPTAPRKIVPRDGVYVVTAQLGERRIGGMMNIGTRPTFDGLARRQEVHLLDFEGDLYGSVLSVEFRERLRDERRFDGIESLVQQLNADEARCRDLLKGIL
ncbi:MAG: bifunctional riboflavin kinase/FAD synthetase [Rhodothermales bacterium]|nr:bifunctional riboflavin kinase/FAD synthetase [Rhodothermales bacterium]MBO6781615.1 bifunctional riboflavin kinase/FAD synthetase [Rhodothermales bacterium]